MFRDDTAQKLLAAVLTSQLMLASRRGHYNNLHGAEGQWFLHSSSSHHSVEPSIDGFSLVAINVCKQTFGAVGGGEVKQINPLDSQCFDGLFCQSLHQLFGLKGETIIRNVCVTARAFGLSVLATPAGGSVPAFQVLQKFETLPG